MHIKAHLLPARSTVKVISKRYPQSKKHIKQTFNAKDNDVKTVVEYPISMLERTEYVNFKTGKRVTPFQFRVYDAVRQIPPGHVTSYKILSNAINSAPRAVGNALRMNPFCPLPVACHRVIATDKSIGGFSGSSGDSQSTADKKAKLEAEGCKFESDYLFKSNVDGTTEFFSDFKTQE